MIDAGATQADPGSTDRSPLMDIFIQGKIGMQVGLPPTVGQIEEGNPDLDYSIVPIPTQDGSPFTARRHGPAHGVRERRRQAGRDHQVPRLLLHGRRVRAVGADRGLPAGHEVGRRAARQSEEALAPFLEVLPDAQFYPSTNPAWSATDAAFKALFGQLQTKPAQDVLTEIQAQADAG